ncbi:hypothetical protein SLEP1_g20822 [Rubroshorea leprosula]|uniref:Uncharacterized protein n=1 Tax=Rubroshorea leprosula TaxID=152421 RepID=A0AAV5JEM4_9ROSI|nr:hypothetical protein SLEP1_g20822 [Rubroshorea leprosula]
MGSGGKLLFDLNEPPTEDNEESDHVTCFQPQKALPSKNSNTSDLFVTPAGTQGIFNKNAFLHASSVSGFRPFVWAKTSLGPEVSIIPKVASDQIANISSSSLKSNNNDKEMKAEAAASLVSGSANAQAVEREEGEWSDAEGSADAYTCNGLHEPAKALKERVIPAVMDCSASGATAGNIQVTENCHCPLRLDQHMNDKKGNNSQNSEGTSKGDMSLSVQEGPTLVPKQREVKGIEASYALKCANTPVKRKIDEQKEAMLGKKRTRKTMFLNLEDVKQVGTIKTSTPRRQSLPMPVITRTVKEVCTASQPAERPRRLGSESDLSSEADASSILRQSSWKQPMDSRQLKNSQFSNKNFGISQETNLQCVPGQFESAEEYIRVFEPLLFEECRAQLYSTWEKLTELPSRDTHVMVCIKSIERRERGWYDVIVLRANECKWTLKEGDVAVLSSPRPGSVIRSKWSNAASVEEGEEPEVVGHVAGTIRRHVPLDNHDPPGAILHFYVGDSYDPNRKEFNDHIRKKLQSRGIWYLTVLGSLATTQREYVALHAFCSLNSLMQTAILKPSPELFPKYEQQNPAMPECFTQNFVDHLHSTFNGPQLLAIQQAAMHTAAGTSSGMTKRQEPWPFTLVQGPPGTGKTHTVWGMLNVIHLVQYQHYYSLLKKLAPESYKQANESNSENVTIGSIDEVLQNMDQNLFRTLPKLCPKPRMLVCAPSNAATDELLARVLDRGFIDGEMKVYRPDVARVGVDSQTRAAQAVSVEHRTEQLLLKSCEEILGHMHALRAREAMLSQQIAALQRELNATAAAVHSQGSVGVDPHVLIAQDTNRDTLLQNLAAVVESRDKVLVEMSRLLILEAKFRPGSNFNLEEARANLEASFANEAEIVFTTVSSSGQKLFSRLTHGFDMVVIDEAAQASEAAVLPPLSLGCWDLALYSRSLFERFQQAGCPTVLLSVQYRMHSQIRDFPSRYFYQGRLTDSESVVNLPDEVYYKDPMLRPYLVYDITHGRESQRDGSVSYQNLHEAVFCLRLYEQLQKTLKSLGVGKITVGIITPYKLQLKCLQREFESVLRSEEGKDVYINTVDAFQGQERDVIIMSCVRASNHGVGFVADIRRMNVALTRAKRALWFLGNANALMQSDDWAALITDAKARNCYMDMDSLPNDFPKDLPTYPSSQDKISSTMRAFKSGGPRHRSSEMHPETRSGTPPADNDKVVKSVSRSDNYQPYKPPIESSLDDLDQSGNKSRDAWQYGIQKWLNSAGFVGKRDY